MNATHALEHFLLTLPRSAAATFLALFPIVDPFGGIPIFFSMTSSWTAQDRRRTAFKTGRLPSSTAGLRSLIRLWPTSSYPSVILSEGTASRSEAVPKSKDPCNLGSSSAA
jgi:hypothetical protein